jgi:ADP-ribose pyrophosphatase YjhB (NUDIX family)
MKKRDERTWQPRCPYIATDIIIEYNDGKKDGIVLITRKNPPYGIALPGGMAEIGLTLEENAVKEAKEETGLEVILKNPEQPLCVHSHPQRDPRAHVISATYIARGMGILKAGDDAKSADIYSLQEIRRMIAENKLVFDHGKTLMNYIVHKLHEWKDK